METLASRQVYASPWMTVREGSRHTLALDLDIVCTGIIRVGYREPLNDHPVDCTELTAVAARRDLAVAVWREGSTVVQVSELYRP
ncbi:MAG: hypothetical protein JWN91_2182 [Nocardioides sp.]|jgi:hypothetical protein|nr:hypothetical protein [Nocardioides sp.]